MAPMVKAALEYINEGFKVFPVKIDKTPSTPHGLKDATQTQQGVKEYWTKYPEAGIGIVTDGLVVMDFDAKSGGLESKELIERQYGLPKTRTHGTGGGGFHYLYRNPNGTDIRNSTKLGGYAGVDLRANGGYIIAPPSHHLSGKDYYVYDCSPLAVAPDWLVEMCANRRLDASTTQTGNQPGWITQLLMGVKEGSRDDSAKKLIGYFKKTLPQDITETLMLNWNQRNQPPLPDSVIKEKVARFYREYPAYNNAVYNTIIYTPTSDDELASDSHKKVTENVTTLSKRIEDWVKETNGWFDYSEVDRELGLASTKDKHNRLMILKRLKENGTIESHKSNNKLYRYINTAVRLIDFKSVTKRNPLAIKYPFGIEYYYSTFPGNIIVIAGSPDAGKTAFLLNFIYLNQYDFSIYYQSSEMGKDELSNRLGNFEGIKLDDWNFTAEERSSNFADVIRPDCVNIIDYMELSGDFYMVAEYLRQIHDKLATGFAIIALQKDPKSPQGRGGTFGLEKPRLYLNMDAGQIVIRKAKNWTHLDQNPNGLILNYKIVGGSKFIITNDWHKDD